MIKLALVMASDGKAVGGMEQQVALQARHLAMRQNIEISVFAHRAYQTLFSAPVHFYEINAQRSRRHPLLRRQLSLGLKHSQPDIIHAHGHKAAALIGQGYAASSKAKRITTAHGTKRNSKFLANMDLIFAVSKGVQHSILPLSSVIIGNAVEQRTERPTSKQTLCTQYALDIKKPLFIASGRLAPVKQYHLLMQACQQLDVNLLIFGDGPERLKLAELQTKRIRLAGYAEHMQSKMTGADALVICSSSEGFSLSMIEALQQGVLVLSSKVSGSDVLPESCIINSSDSEHLEQSLQSKLTKLAQLRSESEPAFRYAREHCMPESLVDLLMKQYHALLPG